MNECFYYLLAVDCIYYVDIDVLTYLRMKSYITHMNTYLPPYFSIPPVCSGIVKKEKKKKKE